VEEPFIKVNVDAKVEVLPGVELSLLQVFGHNVSLQDHSLWYTTVFYLGLSYIDRSIIEIVVDNTLAHSVILFRVLNNTLLEVGIKTQNLPVVFQPLRLDAGYIDVARFLRSWSLIRWRFWWRIC